MKKDNTAIIEEFVLLLKYMDRLREGFRLEKEETLKAPSLETLEKLRDRSKSIYLIGLADYMRDARRLRNRISSDLPRMEEAEDLAKQCDEAASALRAHLTATPNRLIRIFRSGGFSYRDDEI